MTDIGFLGALEAADLIRRRELSSLTYTEGLLGRIGALNSKLNAFLHLDAEGALKAARMADERTTSGGRLGPLHGVPFALKDIIDVAGMPTTAHSKILAGNVADLDAEVTRRLKAAGGIILGKLATHEFAYGGPCFDLPWPPARNPWDLRMFTGGSSSGSGAAVAAGLVPFALGTDTGGSVRNPASLCGLVGMKATYGRVSRHGVIPLAFSLDHVGPMTRTVADNAALLGILAGQDQKDPSSSARSVGDYPSAARAGAEDGIAGLKVGVIRHFHRADMIADPQVDRAIEAALSVIAQVGARIEELTTLPLDAFLDAQRVILLSESYAVHRHWLQSRPEDYARATREKLLPGAFMSAADYIQALRNRPRFVAAVNALFDKVDIIVTVSSMDLPFPIEDEELAARSYPRQARAPFNLTGHPALVLPVGFTDGAKGDPPLPLSMQLVGRHFDEATIYRVAAAYEAATGWTKRHPPIGEFATDQAAPVLALQSTGA